MKNEKLNLSRTEFPVVNSLDNLEVGRIYTTYNYKMIKSLEYNRGKKEGYLPERVAVLQTMHNDGKFYLNVCHVLVNLKGKAIDGNNRKKFIADNNLPLNFMITAQPEFNLEDESEILNNVSEYNMVNTAWSGKDAFQSALAFNEPLAVFIDNMIVSIENKNGIPGEMFTPSRIIALATHNKPSLNGKVQPRRAYCNKETLAIVQSTEFQNELSYIIDIVNFVRANNNSITAFDVVRCLMPQVWKNEMNLKPILANMKKRGFKKMDNTKMVGVKARVNEILKMGNI